MAPRSLHLAPLPPPAWDSPRPAVIQDAYRILVEAYNGASQLLRYEDGDPIRLQVFSDRICSRILPIAQELGRELKDDVWLMSCLQDFSSLVEELDDATQKADRV